MGLGGCRNVGPFLDPYDNTAPNIQGTQKGTLVLTTTHISLEESRSELRCLRLGRV